MSIISFLEAAGETLFRRPAGAASAAHAMPAATNGAAAPVVDGDALNRSAAEAIGRYLEAKGLAAGALKVSYDGATRTATVSGAVDDQATREKIVLLAGNVANVHHVNDQLSVSGHGAGVESRYYEVKAGDSLSTIARDAYGSSDQADVLFKANRPMLSDPDKIYPGQKLRIPRLS